MNRYFKIFKPFHVLSQFTPQDDKLSLKNFFKVPSNAYPIGRLDYDSEGLLILTDDKKLNELLLHPRHGHKREYWSQVEGIPNEEQLSQLTNGPVINVNGKKHKTQKCTAQIFEPLFLPERNPPIRFRKNIADTWIKIILSEGKNRQVRKMTAAVGLPTLRLIRYAIEDLTIENMHPGDCVEISKQEIYNLLHIKM